MKCATQHMWHTFHVTHMTIGLSGSPLANGILHSTATMTTYAVVVLCTSRHGVPGDFGVT